MEEHTCWFDFTSLMKKTNCALRKPKMQTIKSENHSSDNSKTQTWTVRQGG